MHRVAVRGVALTAAVAVLATPVGSQTLPPSVVAPAPATAAGWARLTLANGIVVLVAERPGIPIVIARASVEAGSVLDPPSKGGVANLTALLLTRGNATRSALEVDRAIEFVGGSLEGEGGRDSSEVVLSVLRKDLGLGLDLLTEALVRPAFPEPSSSGRATRCWRPCGARRRIPVRWRPACCGGWPFPSTPTGVP